LSGPDKNLKSAAGATLRYINAVGRPKPLSTAPSRRSTFPRISTHSTPQFSKSTTSVRGITQQNKQTRTKGDRNKKQKAKNNLAAHFVSLSPPRTNGKVNGKGSMPGIV